MDRKLKEARQAKLAILETILQLATQEHTKDCSYYQTRHFADCDCGAQTDGADLCDEVCTAITMFRGLLKGDSDV